MGGRFSLLLALGIAFLVWGALDIYHFFTIWTDLFQQYVGTDLEAGISALGRHQLLSGGIKLLLGVIMGILDRYKRKRGIG